MSEGKKVSGNVFPALAGGIFAIVLVSVLAGVLLVSLFRANQDVIFPVALPEPKAEDAAGWLGTVVAGDEKRALLYAKTLVRDDDPEMPDPDYIDLMLRMGLGTGLLTSPFNTYDYRYWEGLEACSGIWQEAAGSVEAAFEIVCERVKGIPRVEGYVPAGHLVEILERGSGTTQERCRVLSLVVRQGGYGAHAVTLVDDTGRPVHVFCEIRKGEEVYLADLRYGFIDSCTCVLDYERNPDRIPPQWPEVVAGSIGRRFCSYPAEPGEYRRYNQLLGGVVKGLLGDSAPLFGADPHKALDRYIETYASSLGGESFSYWIFPFESLVLRDDFPIEWHRHEKR
ncbi:MAG: hypothetical protein JW808_00970, partial [Victivallales bacterium]|nr:hypothetical protein [Victivallales bacterium]